MEQCYPVLERSPEPSYEFYASGFPFDDNMSRGRQDIRSHLEDLAQRHPEFADQLRCPPWGGEVGPSQGSWNRARQSSCGDDSSSSQPPEQEQAEELGPLGGKARQNNLPQHGLRNTVDLGKQQQEADQEKSNRGQRSMSAPPDSRTPDQPQRFVSRIDINPLNPSAGNMEGKPPMAPKQQQQQSPHKPSHQGTSNVRHIPIFVEGRDEPVVPKNIDSAPEKIFTERTIPTHNAFPSERIPPQTPFVERVIPTQSAFPSERVSRPQSPFKERAIPTRTTSPQPSFSFNRPSHFTSQQQFHPQQPSPVPQGKKQAHQQPVEQQHTQPNVQPNPTKPPINDPLLQVQAVEKDVEQLAKKVESYKGNSRKDKDYIYLDEMLTRNLLKLDVIETEGKENVRQARKAVIKNIQRCINVLESKVPVPEESMEISDELTSEQRGELKEMSGTVEISPEVTEVPQQSATNEGMSSEQNEPLEDSMTVEEEPSPCDVISTKAEPLKSLQPAQVVEQSANMKEPLVVEEAAQQDSTASRTELSDPTNKETENCPAPCVQMTGAVSHETKAVTGENKQAEPTEPEVVGNCISSELLQMDVDSGVQVGQDGEVKVDSAQSANDEVGNRDQSPSKVKKSGKKVTGKSKKSTQPSS